MQVSPNPGEQINAVIDHLASKLAVPAAQLWAILIRQTYVHLAGDALYAVALILGWLFVFRPLMRKANADKYDKEGWIIATALSGVALSIMSCIFFYGFIVDVQYALNPGFFALSNIISALR